jgi:4-hydroxy-tetrahydrodipicolinate synthase
MRSNKTNNLNETTVLNSRNNKQFKGVVVPMITPFTSDFHLDEIAVEKIVANLYKNNLQPFILGTTGESASLSMNIKKAYIKKAATLKMTGTHVYVGIGSNCLEESIELANMSADYGVDVVVATIPSYYALTEIETKKYFEQLANHSPLPLIIYNIPSTTHVSLPLTIIEELSYHNNIVGMKDSERNNDRLLASLALWKDRKDFSHFVGWAAKSTEALLSGSDGIIPSTGNLFPKLYKELYKAVQVNDVKQAYAYQLISDAVGDIYQSGKSLGSSLWALKYLMYKIELCEPLVLAPLQNLSNEEGAQLVAQFNMLLQENKLGL